MLHISSIAYYFKVARRLYGVTYRVILSFNRINLITIYKDIRRVVNYMNMRNNGVDSHPKSIQIHRVECTYENPTLDALRVINYF